METDVAIYRQVERNNDAPAITINTQPYNAPKLGVYGDLRSLHMGGSPECPPPLETPRPGHPSPPPCR